jgi:hypothetical protein
VDKHKITCKIVIFGSFTNLTGEILSNHVIILIKHYIFQYKENNYLFDQMIQIFEETCKIEKYIAKRNDRLTIFINEWYSFLQAD